MSIRCLTWLYAFQHCHEQGKPNYCSPSTDWLKVLQNFTVPLVDTDILTWNTRYNTTFPESRRVLCLSFTLMEVKFCVAAQPRKWWDYFWTRSDLSVSMDLTGIIESDQRFWVKLFLDEKMSMVGEKKRPWVTGNWHHGSSRIFSYSLVFLLPLFILLLITF